MANFMDLMHKSLDLAHKAMDAHTADTDEPAPDPKPKKTDPTYGLHPGEGEQIKDMDLLGTGQK